MTGVYGDGDVKFSTHDDANEASFGSCYRTPGKQRDEYKMEI